MDTKLSPKTLGQQIKDLKQGSFLKLGKIAPSGSLEARRLTNGLVLYWRVTLDGKTERTVIGNYDSSASPKQLTPSAKGYSIQAATRAAEVLSQKHHDNKKAGGYRGLIEAEAKAAREEAEAIAETKRQTEQLELEASQYTLKALLLHYCDHLEKLERRSHKDARSIFELHVNKAWPAIAALPANQVTGEQVADMMRKLLENKKGRTANKLRSYTRAAYQTALAARSKASIPLHFKAYNVRSNPASDTLPDESANKADKHPLSAAELRTYWRSIKTMPGFVGAALRLHLLTGGQRIEQLCSLLTANVTDTTMTLLDGKGRPGKAPRPHTVPLITDAAAAMLELKPHGTYALSTDDDGQTNKGKDRKFKKGEKHLSAITLSHWAVAAGAGIPDFATKRIRSGVETLLASARIPTEIRGRLQSHGISGVQARHYDGYSYLDEKRHALETLFTLLDAPESSNVVQFKAA